MFWRLNYYWPHHNSFNKQNFGNQPIVYLLRAVQQGQKLRQEELHLQELGMATLTACFVNSNRDPKKSSPAKPNDFYFFDNQDFQSVIPTSVVSIFFNLVDNKLLPPWSLSVLPIREFQRLKKMRTKKTYSYDYLNCDDCILLLGVTIEQESKRLHSDFIAVFSGSDYVIVSNHLGVSFKIYVPKIENECDWGVDFYFPIID